MQDFSLNLQPLSNSLNVLHIPRSCKKIYTGEIDNKLGDPFLQELRDIARNDKDASKLTFETHGDLSRLIKGRPQKFVFQIGTLNPHK